jgi:uncharacterized protein involved in exopolysaccharide biosynthesis
MIPTTAWKKALNMASRAMEFTKEQLKELRVPLQQAVERAAEIGTDKETLVEEAKQMYEDLNESSESKK